ncbi:unnamed protein product [Prorocentrum cordatum]|uniref:Uncharacterized protein n=1 Tax=Prorocentrum cordatum TaxID=2364126 RepID=A0ABN9XWV5_9DINO|nr:unnamed protein product [Polarella glacialis]
MLKRAAARGTSGSASTDTPRRPRGFAPPEAQSGAADGRGHAGAGAPGVRRGHGEGGDDGPAGTASGQAACGPRPAQAARADGAARRGARLPLAGPGGLADRGCRSRQALQLQRSCGAHRVGPAGAKPRRGHWLPAPRRCAAPARRGAVSGSARLGAPVEVAAAAAPPPPPVSGSQKLRGAGAGRPAVKGAAF